MRFRGAFFGSNLSAEEAAAVTMDTAGKAVLFSGLTVLISLSRGDAGPEPGLPVDEPRDHALGHLRPGGDAHAAAGRAREARPAGRPALAALGPLRRAPLAALRDAGASGCGGARSPSALPPLVVLLVLAFPVTQLKTAMPSIKVVPTGDSSRGIRAGAGGVRARAPGACRSSHPRRTRGAWPPSPRPTPESRRSCPPQRSRRRLALSRRSRRRTPPTQPSAQRSTGSAPSCPPAALVGGAVAENHDLEQALAAKTPLVIGVVLGLGFLLLLFALQAPLIAAVGVVTNLLATGAAFGVAKWIFQDGAASLGCSASSRRASSTPGGRCSSSR